MTEERADQIIKKIKMDSFDTIIKNPDLRFGQTIWINAIKINKSIDSLTGTNKDCFNNDHNIERFLKEVKEILLSEREIISEEEVKSYLFIKQKIQSRGNELIYIYSDTVEKVTAVFDDIYEDSIAYSGVGDNGEPFEIILKAKYLTMSNKEVRKELRRI